MLLLCWPSGDEMERRSPAPLGSCVPRCGMKGTTCFMSHKRHRPARSGIAIDPAARSGTHSLGNDRPFKFHHIAEVWRDNVLLSILPRRDECRCRPSPVRPKVTRQSTIAGAALTVDAMTFENRWMTTAYRRARSHDRPPALEPAALMTPSSEATRHPRVVNRHYCLRFKQFRWAQCFESVALLRR